MQIEKPGYSGNCTKRASLAKAYRFRYLVRIEKGTGMNV